MNRGKLTKNLLHCLQNCAKQRRNLVNIVRDNRLILWPEPLAQRRITNLAR